MDLETSRVAARHFVNLAMFRQQQGTTVKKGSTPFKQTSGETRKQRQRESPFARRLRSAGISEGRLRPSRASSSILVEEGSPVLFFQVAMLYSICSVVYFLFSSFANFPCYHAIRFKKNSPLRMGAIRTREPDAKQFLSRSWIISVLDSKGYCCIGMFLCMFDHRRVIFSHKTDVDQSVLGSIRFELIAYK